MKGPFRKPRILSAGAGAPLLGPDPDGLSAYLREAGRVPLLPPDLEVELARELDLSRRALRSVARKLPRRLGREAVAALRSRPIPGKSWPLEDVDRFVEDLVRSPRRDSSAAGVLAEARTHKRRLDRARDALILANLRLVVHIAKKYTRSGISLLDRVQEGNLGLIKAVDRFDHKRGNRFSTYAYWWIKQSIERAIGNQGRTVRVPVHVQDKLRKIRRASESLQESRRREATTEEIADELGLSAATVRDVLRSARDADPLEDPEEPSDHLRRAADPRAVCPFEREVDRQRRRGVEQALKSLTPQEERVVRLRFGLDCEARPTLEAIGSMLDLSRERVRQIEQQALTKIRSNAESAALVGLVEGG